MYNFSSSYSLEETSQEYDEEIKIIVLGETGVGKSNIIIRYSGGQFEPNSVPNNCSSFIFKYLTFGNKIYRINVWDTAGQEKYHSLTKIFIKDSQIALLVYAINDYDSFQQLDYWYNTLKESCKNTIIAVVGNKIDLYAEEVVDQKEAKDKAKKFNANFGLTSAFNDDTGIDEIIEKLVKEYIKSKGESIESKPLKNFENNNIKLKKKILKKKSKKKNSNCC